jgi:hypothetical protein
LCITPIAAFGHDVEVWLIREEIAQAMSNDGMVIDDGHTRHRGAARTPTVSEVNGSFWCRSGAGCPDDPA